MPTVTLEFGTDDLVPLGVIPEGLFDHYEEIELLETLRLERGWRLQLLRIRRRGPLRTESELIGESARIRRVYGLENFELVERRPRTRDYIVLVRQRNPDPLRRILDAAGGGVTPTAPFLLSPEKVIASFHGEPKYVRRILTRLTREGLPFRVLRTSPHPAVPSDGSATLTTKQESALARAWTLGFYAVPRRITLTRLARLNGLSAPALGKMLRRAEGRLVARFLAASAPGSLGATNTSRL